MATIRHKTVVGVDKGKLPVKYFTATNPLFVSVKFFCDHKSVAKMRNPATLSLGRYYQM